MDARTDGLTIRYDDNGSANPEPALVCLPGWCANKTAFRALLGAFAGKRRVLALDWRGHGESERPSGDFGAAELVRDVRAVLDAARVRRAIPLATAHAGWVAIDLRRQLGAEAIPKLVLVDWIVGPAPPPFAAGLKALQDPAMWQATRERLFTMWLHGVDDPAVIRFVRDEMGAYGFDMWSRGGRQIAAAYARAGSPLEELTRLAPPPPTLHLYPQERDDEAQRAFAATHAWFSHARLGGHSHFPTIESVDELVPLVERFAAG